MEGELSWNGSESLSGIDRLRLTDVSHLASQQGVGGLALNSREVFALYKPTMTKWRIASDKPKSANSEALPRNTTVRTSKLFDAEVGAAAGDLVNVYYVYDLAPKHQHQDFAQQGVERLASHICEIARDHVNKEPSQPDSQTTSQPIHTRHIGLTVRCLSLPHSLLLPNLSTVSRKSQEDRKWERAQVAVVTRATSGRTTTPV
ncbi:unnamed protein product [Schistocephalus solidus]|uniref:CPSF_A domain-containing protein n=1 Tax=Schistocephalus solidus TaxID=70667 RepID=A0A183SE46_SCHSO|nr:unnamed protein product [Schistocephalus solidus]